MNKIQLGLLWLAAAALSVYLFIKGGETNIAAGAGVMALMGFITWQTLRRPNVSHEHTGFAHAQQQAAADLSNAAHPSVAIPGMGKKSIVYKKDFLEYKGKSYYYKNIQGVLYITTSLSVHGIPSSQSYIFGINGTEGKFTVSFASAFYIGNDKMKEIYVKLIEMSKIYIEPHIISGMVREIFSNGRPVKIGPVEFTKDGYSRKKLFGGIEEVKWADRVYIPQYADGLVYVYKDNDGNSKTFTTISMQKENAVVLPELVQACYDKYHGINREVPAQ